MDEIPSQFGIRLSESKTHVAHCAASGNACEQKVLPVLTNDVNKQ